MTTTIFLAALTATSVGVPKASDTVLKGVLNTAYFWAAVLAVVVIIAAGFYYVTSNGNAQQVVRAKNAILGAVVGLIVILSAFTITNAVMGGF